MPLPRLAPHHRALAALAVAFVALALLYADAGLAKAISRWNWIDIAGEGGTALMSAVWLVAMLASRPAGRVTTLLAAGLAAFTLGMWADFLDEFYKIPAGITWNHWLEALTPVGVLLISIGLYYFRDEQLVLNEHLHKRERLLRDHRAFDGLTQLANADYLRRLLRLELGRRPEANCAVVLLDVDGFHRVNREHGAGEADRLLQALAHLWLLNLRHGDLLCRYAGDRFAVVMPETELAAARRLGEHLARAAGVVIAITVRVASALADRDVERLLARLNGEIEEGTPSAVSATAA